MTGLAERVEAALTPERFRAWLDGIGNRGAAFNARDCEMCALGRYVNDITDWEPILAVGLANVFVSEHEDRMEHSGDPTGHLCYLPEWARTFVKAHDRNRERMEHVSLDACYRALEGAA